ncbi:MAG TPA: glycosyltransferase family 4 protein [Rudaea sp.]
MARVLFLSARLPYPPREGHQLRTWHMLRGVAAAHEVSLVSFVRDDDVPDECASLRSLVAHFDSFAIPAQQSSAALLGAAARGIVGARPFVAEKYSSKAMRVRVAELIARVDLVHVDLLPLMSALDDCTTRRPIVLDAHNVEHQLLEQRAQRAPGALQRTLLRGQAAKLKRYERAAVQRAAQVLACSRDDADQLSRLAPETSISVVPNGVDVDRCRPRPVCSDPVSRQLVFVGQMGWFPNREGVQWFLGEIFPRIVECLSDVEFVVVGKAEGLHIPAALRDRVRLMGFVPDLSAIVQDAAVYVVPLRSGSGTRLKVLEAMAFGKAIVTTAIGAEGIDLVPGEEAVFANDAGGFARAVVALIENPEAAARLGAAARARAEAQYDWRGIEATLRDIYVRTVDRQPSLRAPARQR